MSIVKAPMLKLKTNGYGSKNNDNNKSYVQSHAPTSASSERSKETVFGLLNGYGNKVEKLAGGLKDHLKFGPSIRSAAKARLVQGTKMFVGGGAERVFQREFGMLAMEKLIDSFVCYVSTTSGLVTGTLYISNRRIAFCSDYAIRLPSAGEKDVPVHYKVVMELEKIRNVGSSSNVVKPSEKYVNVVTQDGLEFWFVGFVSYMDAYICLNKAHHNIQYDSVV